MKVLALVRDEGPSDSMGTEQSDVNTLLGADAFRRNESARLRELDGGGGGLPVQFGAPVTTVVEVCQSVGHD